MGHAGEQLIWEDFLFFLHIIPPTVQKLSLPNLWPLPIDPMPLFPVLAKQLVEKLDKFEEVDFGRTGILRGLGMAEAVLRTVSAKRDSKLRILSMPGYEDDFDPDLLVEARKTLTVNMSGLIIDLGSLDSDDEDGDEEDGDEEDVIQIDIEEENEDEIEDTK